MSVRLPDGLTRRGDINVLLLGDPGTAKSQLLKFVENCSPVGVSVSFIVIVKICKYLLFYHCLHGLFFLKTVLGT